MTNTFATAGTTTRSRTVVALVLLTTMLASMVASASSAFAAVPTVLKVAPVAVAPGHAVTITGTDFVSTTAVTFLGTADAGLDDVPATSFLVLSPTILVAQVPPGAVTGPVQVTNADGTSSPSPASVTILRPPAISAVSATVVRGNDQITVDGTNLGIKRKVTIAGKTATVLLVPVPTAQSFKVVVPPGLPGGPAPLNVIAEGGTGTASVYIAPEIKGILPKASNSTGGAVAVLTGSGFTGAQSVSFNGVDTTDFLLISDKEIAVKVPAGTEGNTPVTVKTSAGGTNAESLPITFLYQPIPTITSISRNWAPVSPSPTTVTITGKNLTATTVVTLGAAAVATTVDTTAGTLTFDAPSTAKAGVLPLTLINTFNTVAYKTVVTFTYANAPTVAKVSPTSAPAGSTVVVTGTGFITGATASFGGTPSSCTLVTALSLRCVAPSVAVGPANVTVTTDVGTGPVAPAANVVFTYINGSPIVAAGPLPPAIKSVLPAAAPVGRSVAINGAQLDAVTAVTFPTAAGGRVAAVDTLLVSPKRLIVRVPAGAVSGELQLDRASGPSIRSGIVRFTLVAPLSISSIAAVGERTTGVTGGDTVLIKGDGLMVGLVRPVVTIGGLPATVLSFPTPTQTAVAVKVPPGVGGSAPVTMTTLYAKVDAPVPLYQIPQIKTKKPVLLANGQYAVNIGGLGFSRADLVTSGTGRLSAATFAGIASTQIVVMNDKLMFALPDATSSVYDELEIRTQHEGWSGTSTGATTSLNVASPTITAVSPDATTLGTAPSPVTISGTNLSMTTGVKFGAASATVVSADPGGTSMVVEPPTRSTAARVDVIVTNIVNGEAYSGTLANGFGYLPIPTVTGLSPVSAPVDATPADVTITGQNLLANSIVRFDGNPAAVRSAAADGSSMVVTPPTGTVAAIVDVTATNIFDGQTMTATVTGGYAYTLDPATVTGLSVSTAGPGTQITISGTGFSGVTSVMIGSAAALFTVSNSTTILATIPATPTGLHGTAEQVRVINATGSPSTGNNPWTWDATPTITAVAPSFTTVGETPASSTITGSNLLTTTAVTFGGVAATVVSAVADGTSMIVVPPVRATAGSVSIKLVNTVNAAPYSATLADSYNYKPVPSVTGVTPATGAVGSTPGDVTITGKNLHQNSIVRFGADAATVRSALADGTQIVVAPPTLNTAGPVDVTVTNSYGAESLIATVSGGYTYTLNAASLTGISANTAAAGAQVNVSGTNFVGVTAVQFGGTSVPFTVANISTIIVTVPATPSTLHGSTVAVNVVNGTGSPSTGAVNWTWGATPSITAVTPSSTVLGDTPGQVTVTGTNLLATTAVTFGGVAATFVSVVADGSSMVVVPPAGSAAGAVALNVSNTIDGTAYVSALIDGFNYLPTPSITTLTPSAGPINTAPDAVTITGKNLLVNSVVRFGTQTATVQSAAADGTSMVVLPPVSSVGGAVDVVVTNIHDGASLTATVTNGYGYALSTATVTGLSATAGAAGSQMTITGTDFAGVSTVNFGATSVPFTVANSTTIYVTVPSTPAGLHGSTVGVSVINGTGNASTGSYSWTWDARPSVTSVAPSSAPVGQAPAQVTITGYNLTSGTSVTFGATAATFVSVAADGTSMVVVPPTGTVAGPVTITATNIIGGQGYNGTLANGYRYLPTPSVTAISPASGGAGATNSDVMLTGTNLLSSSVVRFANVAGTVVSAAPDGTSMVVTPPVRDAVGAVNVTVTNSYDGVDMTATVTNGYTYQLLAATVTGLSSTTAPAGTQVTITGTSFSGVSSVTLGATSVAFTVANATTIYATIPVTPTGLHGTSVAVGVVNGTGSPSTGAVNWTWDSAAMITSMSLNGAVAGSSVTVTGTGFTGTTNVRFDTVEAVFAVVSDTELTVTVPATPLVGTVADLTVVARTFTSSEPLTATANDWTWWAIAAVNAVSPIPALAGSTATVTGRNFEAGMTVIIEVDMAGWIIDVSASVALQSPTSFTFTVPTRPGGNAWRNDKPLVVTNGSGTENIVDAGGSNRFQWG